MTCMAAWPVVPVTREMLSHSFKGEPCTLYLWRGYVITQQLFDSQHGFSVYDPQAPAAYAAEEIGWGADFLQAALVINETVDGERRRKEPRS